jgi:serine/threonine protein kinase
MLCGKPPFFGKNKEEVYSCIKFQKLEEAYPREIEKVISNKAKDFLSKVLCKDPEKRLSAIDALQHPWLVNLESSDVSVSDKELGGVV